LAGFRIGILGAEGGRRSICRCRRGGIARQHQARRLTATLHLPTLRMLRWKAPYIACFCCHCHRCHRAAAGGELFWNAPLPWFTGGLDNLHRCTTLIPRRRSSRVAVSFARAVHGAGRHFARAASRICNTGRWRMPLCGRCRAVRGATAQGVYRATPHRGRLYARLRTWYRVGGSAPDPAAKYVPAQRCWKKAGERRQTRTSHLPAAWRGGIGRIYPDLTR